MDEPRGPRQQIVDRLKDLFHQHGYHRIADVERLMKRRRGYVADALRGSKEDGSKKTGKRLTVELILEILAAFELPPETLFVLQPLDRRKAQRSLPGEIAEPDPTDLPSPIREDSLLMKALVLELADKQVVSVEELLARVHDLAESEGGPAPPRG